MNMKKIPIIGAIPPLNGLIGAVWQLAINRTGPPNNVDTESSMS